MLAGGGKLTSGEPRVELCGVDQSIFSSPSQMKRLALLILVALTAGVIAFFIIRSQRMSQSGGVLLDSLPELAWLRTELKLSDVEFEKVSALHTSYRPRCVELCESIHQAHCAMVSLSHKNREMTPELAAAIREHSRVLAECQQAMLEHIYQTSATLSSEKAKLYLDRVLPHALHEVTSNSALARGPH
jgi:hypothetical protein